MRALEIDENFKQTKIEWTVHRVFWAIAWIVLALALLGIFGNSPLTRKSVRMGPAGTIVYDRFVRMSAPTDIRYELAGAKGQATSVFLSRDVLEMLNVEKVTPEPERVEMVDGGLEYHFAAAPSAKDTEAVFEVKPQKPGRIEGEIRTGAGNSITFEQFVYP